MIGHCCIMSRSPLLTGLPPIAAPDAEILILGNMPSVMSLSARQYYANPRNTFWRIACELFGCPADAAYEERADTLRRNRVALWDVLRQCRRTGSLDSAIEPASMVPNDFATFFADHPHIVRVYFNGAAAQRNYDRLVAPNPGAGFVRLPSTSPAQTMRYADKLAAWRVITGS